MTKPDNKKRYCTDCAHFDRKSCFCSLNKYLINIMNTCSEHITEEELLLKEGEPDEQSENKT